MFACDLLFVSDANWKATFGVQVAPGTLRENRLPPPLEVMDMLLVSAHMTEEILLLIAEADSQLHSFPFGGLDLVVWGFWTASF